MTMLHCYDAGLMFLQLDFDLPSLSVYAQFVFGWKSDITYYINNRVKQLRKSSWNNKCGKHIKKHWKLPNHSPLHGQFGFPDTICEQLALPPHVENIKPKSTHLQCSFCRYTKSISPPSFAIEKRLLILSFTKCGGNGQIKEANSN